MNSVKPDTRALSPAMMMVLGEMPVRLKQYVTGGGWFLPWASGSGATFKALERRGLIVLVERDHTWNRTPLGERVWDAR